MTPESARWPRVFGHDWDAESDTVLGLSMTPTRIGCVLVKGRDATGDTVDRDEFDVHLRRGVRVANTSAQAIAAVLRTQENADALGQRLHAIGVTWNDNMVAEAALLLEALSQAGFDNVVSVRFLHAAETLARYLGPVIGYEKIAVCVLEPDSATIAMVDGFDGATQTAVEHTPVGNDDLTRWLTALCERDEWQPDALVVVGSNDDLNVVVRQLEEVLTVPVFGHAGAELALARGAALASTHHAVFNGAGVDELLGGFTTEDAPVLSRSRSYTAALTMLAAGVITFVTSLSLAAGLRLTSETVPESTTVQHVAQDSTVPPIGIAEPPVRQAPVPPPAEAPAPGNVPEPASERAPFAEPVIAPVVEPQPGLSAEPPADLPAVPPIAPAQQQPVAPPPPLPEPDPHPLLTQLIERLQGHPDNPPPEEPQLPPNAGLPTP